MTVTVLQVKDDKTRNYGFMHYDFIKEKYGGVDLENYAVTATVSVPKSVTDTDNIDKILEYVFMYGNSSEKFYADNPLARSISVSDILCIRDDYYYVDYAGFVKLDGADLINGSENLEEDKELLAEEGEDEKESSEDEKESSEDESSEQKSETEVEDEVDEEEADKTLLDYLQDRIGQQMTVGEFNTVLQSLFATYNKVYLLKSDLYNMDLDESQELIVDDEEDMYVINYDIVDVDEAIIEITDVNLEN